MNPADIYFNYKIRNCVMMRIKNKYYWLVEVQDIINNFKLDSLK